MSGAVGTRRGRRVTAADVAREAGVSRTTVSFVLNETPHQVIPQETRQRVREAAARLAYAPSAEARALSRGRSDVVLLHLPPDLPLGVDVGDLVEQLAAAMTRFGLTLVVHPGARSAVAEVWTAVSPAAVIAWHLEDTDAAAMRRNGVQVVVSLAGSDAIGRWVTGPREDEIARLQVATMTRAGHRRLGYAAPDDDRMAGAARLRERALQLACAEAGLVEPVAVRVPHDPAGAAEAVATWRAVDPPVTGICAHDGTAALAVLAGARGAGLAVPGDLAVVGVNDTAAAALAHPPLTMVTVDATTSAGHIAEVVDALLHDRPVPESGPTVAGLIERSSV